MSTNVVLCGVGGQGTILAAHVLAQVALANGNEVKVSEIHGMAQRGGAVVTNVVFGDAVHSMVSDEGCADVVVAFELIEALRNIDMLKPGGMLIANDEVIKPASVLRGKAQVPANLRERLQDAGAIIVPAHAIATEIGSPKVANVVLLGALSAGLSFQENVWEQIVESSVPPKTIDMNRDAFRAGRAHVQEREK